MRRGRDVAEILARHDGWPLASRAESVLPRRQHVLHLVEAAFDAAQHFPVVLARADRLLRRGKDPVVRLDIGTTGSHRGLVQATFH